MHESYYHRHEADMFKFYQMPKELFTNPIYKKISTEAKVLYGILLDRNSLSLKNDWIDKENRVYIFFSRQEAMEILSFSDKTVTKIFKELKEVNLIEEKKQGLGKANIIYVKKFIQSTENKEFQQNRKIYDSGMGKNTIQQSKNLRGSNTDIINTENKSSSTKLKLDDEVYFSALFTTKTNGVIANKKAKELIKKYGLDKLISELDLFLDKTKNQPLKNIAGAFISYLNGDFIPAIKQDSELSNKDNFTERKYNSSDFEKYYKRLDEWLF